MKTIDSLFNKTNNKRNYFLNTISYCTFACFLISTNISNAEVGINHYSIPTGTTTQFYSSNNTEEETLPSGMIRIFVDKNHMESIVVGKQDCSIMRNETDTYGFGFKIGGLLYGMGPEIYYGHSSGINWNWGTQLMVAEFQELCTRFNTGRLSQEEYSEEVYGIINRSRNYTKELEERLKKKKDALFQEIDEWNSPSS
jgi:hypothetical protein